MGIKYFGGMPTFSVLFTAINGAEIGSINFSFTYFRHSQRAKKNLRQCVRI